MRRTLFSLAVVSLTAWIQGWAYYSHLPLSLGPRVILQPWMMLRGRLLYRDIGDEHAPLMYLILALLRQFTQNGLLLAQYVLVSLLTINVLLVFWVGKSLGGNTAGVLSALFFGLWSPLFGYGKLWHETFLAPLYLLLVIQYPSWPGNSRAFRDFFVSGLLVGIALLIKQHALAVLIGVLCWEWIAGRWFSLPPSETIRRSAVLLVGAMIPVSLFVGYYLSIGGRLNDLIFWTVTFNFINDYFYLAQKFPEIHQIRLLAPAYLLVLPTILSVKCDNDGHVKSKIGLAGILLVASSATIFPRFEPFHLQASLPILSVISGYGLARLLRRPERSVGREGHVLGIGVACSLLGLWSVWGGMVYYRAFRSEEPRRIWEYSDLIPLKDLLRERLGENECIYILPDDEGVANLYYLMGCVPPGLWVPTSYPWFSLDLIRQRVLQDLANTPPKWVVYFPGRWEIERHSPDIIAFVRDRYRPVDPITWDGQVVHLLRLR